MSFDVLRPDGLAPPRGFSHGLVGPAGGRVVLVAGQTAADESGRVPELDFVTQFGRALDHVLAIVRQAGGGPTDVGRLTVYVTDLDVYRESLEPLGEAYRARMGAHYPAMALVEVSRLVDPNAVVEIEATAVLS